MTTDTLQLGALDPAYPHGTVVMSGNVLLRCDHGLWLGPGDGSKP